MVLDALSQVVFDVNRRLPVVLVMFVHVCSNASLIVQPLFKYVIRSADPVMVPQTNPIPPKLSRI